MGLLNWIKKVILVIICIILLISLLAMNALFVVSSSLSHDNVKQSLKPVIANEIYKNMSNIDSNFNEMKIYCQSHTEFNITNGYDFSIPCNEILNGTSESIVDSQIDKFIDDFYYKQYNCNFWQCFNGNPFFIVSETSYKYLKNNFYISIVISIILALIIFFLVDFKRNLLIILGILLVLSSLPFAKFDIFSNLVNEEILSFLTVLFKQANLIFLIIFILGIVLIASGIGLKIWNSKSQIKKK